MPLSSRPSLVLTAAVLAAALLAACSAPRDTFPQDAGDVEDVGGLTADQSARLRALGVPVVVPGDLYGFTLAVVEAERRDGGSVRYALDYRRSDGSCFQVSGGSGGFGGPDLPLVSTEVRVPGLGGRSVRVYEAADVPGATSAQVWGVGTVVSDFIDLDSGSALFLSDTQGGCRPVPLEEGSRIVGGLRLLAAGTSQVPRLPGTTQPAAPADARALGAFAPADDVLSGLNTASTPDIAAQAIARRYDDDADRVTVDVLSESSYEAVALVTLLGLRDDSVRDERLRLTYTRVGEAWELIQAGRQVRCQSGRGPEDWSADACR